MYRLIRNTPQKSEFSVNSTIATYLRHENKSFTQMKHTMFKPDHYFTSFNVKCKAYVHNFYANTHSPPTKINTYRILQGRNQTLLTRLQSFYLSRQGHFSLPCSLWQRCQ